jgi:DNA-binding PadR family transcriptional regulator
LIALGRRPARDRPTGFCVVYLLSLLFALPVFVFSSPYAAVGGMTIGHGFQYLLLVGAVAVGRRSDRGRLLRLAVFGNIAVIGGTALSAASHLHGSSPAGRLLFGAYLGVVMAHFVVDAGFWRMRDPSRGRSWPGACPFSLPHRSVRAHSPWIVRRYRMTNVARPTRRPDPEPPPVEPLSTFGRYAGPATLILSSLADGAKHGYALTKDIESFAGVHLAPGTLYEALSRLETQGLIEALESHDRRRPYQLTAVGASTLRVHLDAQRRVADLGLRRLSGSWGTP